jgi:protein O-mannosyl-transferase
MLALSRPLSAAADCSKVPEKGKTSGTHYMTWLRLSTSFFLFVLFFVIVLGLSYNGLSAPMYYDSAGNLAEKESIFATQGLPEVVGLFPQRPLPMITFYLNYAIAGMDPRFFRVVNCALLAATALAVVVLMDLILGIPEIGRKVDAATRAWLSVGLGMLFLVHPVQTYQTLYIWQRMALMACLFSYASFAVYLAVRIARWANPSTGYPLCVFLFLCALLSKENSVAVPLLFILAEICFFPQSWKSVLKRGAAWCLIALIAVAAVSFVQHPHGNVQMGSGILNTMQTYYAESGLTLEEVALTQARLLFRYAFLIVLPLPHTVQLINPQIVSVSLMDPPVTLLAVLGAVAAIAAALSLLRPRPLLTFGMMFYVITLLPEGFLVPQYLFFGYRAVLPLFGVLLIVSDAAISLLNAVDTSSMRSPLRAGLLALLVGAVILDATTTAIRSEIWQDPIRFWKETVAEFPRDSDKFERKVAAHALGNLGAALYSAGRYEEAVGYYERAREYGPGDPRKLVSLAATYGELGEAEKARSLLNEAIELMPTLTTAYKNLGILSLKEGRTDDAVRHFHKAIELAPYDASLQEGLGQALWSQGALDEAAAAFQKVLKIRPDYWQAHNALGAVRAKQGRLAEAVVHFERALKLNPGNRQIRANVETAHQEMRRRVESP